MSPSISKDAILDAAEAIVRESGAAHMTLDGVAERAQVSKGGLMYSFPNKESLLQAMIGRLIDGCEDTRARIREESSVENLNELAVEIKLMAELDEDDSSRTATLLAVIANQPGLMEPFHNDMRKRFSERILSHGNPGRSTILFLAALGLHFTSLLNIPTLDLEQRKNTYADLLRLAACEEDTL